MNGVRMDQLNMFSLEKMRRVRLYFYSDFFRVLFLRDLK